MLFEANVTVYALVAFGLFLNQCRVNPIRVNSDIVPKVVKIPEYVHVFAVVPP